jgi:VanZ family protein
MMLSRQNALRVLAVLLVLLLFGTQMPGAWRDEAFRVTQLPWHLTKVAHFVMFAGIAFVARSRPLRWSVRSVVGVTLGIALLTELLQLYASERNASLQDVGIDMVGAVLGLWLAKGRA